MTIRILGAGVMGLTIAAELVARGQDVRLIDPQPQPGPHGCSWWAGGMLAPFCEAESADDRVLRHGLAAIAWWERYTKVSRNGTLVLTLARDRSELTRFARRSQGHRAVEADEIAHLEPDLEGRFASGLFYPEEAHLDPRRAIADLRRHLVDQGVRFDSAPPAGPAPDLLIDARGLAARDALQDLRGVRGEMLLLRCPDLHLTRPIRLLHPRIPLYVVPRGNGIFMLGATMIESDRPGAASARSVLELLSAAYALHPGFGEAEVIEIGAGVRPAFADNLPKLRRRGGVLYANGLYRHGFLLSPAVASMAADHLIDGKIPAFMDEVL